ncbi:hypothetical protein [Haloferula sp. BvORR071]|uniref:hypothetical protein n=1 Tax=Haloferula sp. BvORR071 TaxID=1396141 RepID=UPI000554C16A|nr:hypothetical protein [Haloferula sp. BvORR071]
MPTPPASTNEIESVAHPAEDFPADRTVVWSPIFQAAWDRMNEELGGPPFKIEPPNALMAKLDSFAWQAGLSLPEGGWKLWSGPNTQEFVDAANREAAQMTGEENGPFDSSMVVPPGFASLAVLALLNRNPAFEVEFHPDPISLRFHSSSGESKTVQCFGIGEARLFDYFESVRIIHYRRESKAIRIAVRKQEGEDDRRGESVVLYLPSQRENFDVAWSRVKGFLCEGLHGEEGSEADPHLHEGDRLCIPYLGLEASADFKSQLQGLRYHSGSVDPWVIAKAKMRTKFEMNEKGVELRVVVEIITVLAGVPDFVPTVPRDLRFDRPFFVFLFRDGAEWPYFGAWFGDHTALRDSSDPELIEQRGHLKVFRRPDTGEEFTVPIEPRYSPFEPDVTLRYLPQAGAGVREAFLLGGIFQGVASLDRNEVLQKLRALQAIEIPGIPGWKADSLISLAAEKGLTLQVAAQL